MRVPSDPGAQRTTRHRGISSASRQAGTSRHGATSLQLPAATVERERLHRRVERAVAHPLTLVAAPPGAGKTMLLAGWSRAHPGAGAVTWVTLDAAARALPGLWKRLAAAAPPNTLDGPAPTDAGAAAARIAAAVGGAAGGRGGPQVLVLDDVHEAGGAVLWAVLRALMELPGAPHIVLSTRVDPALPLQRWRVEGRLAELRADEFAFTVTEADELLTGQGIRLAPADVETLVARTEGWAAGLRLAALMLADHPDPAAAVSEFAGDDRAVVGYLIEEVLDRQPAPARELLLRTAVLDRVTAPLADALTGGAGGQATLEGLVARHAFVVPLDRRATWFRYHALFGELLRAQLARRGEAAVLEQHRRAARWLAYAGLPEEALPHAARAGDWDLLSGVLVEHWLRLRETGAGEVLDHALAAMPPEAVAARPQVALVAAARSFDHGDDGRAEELLGAAACGRDRLAAARRGVFMRDLSLVRLERARIHGDARAGLRERAAARAWSQSSPERDRHARALAHLELGRLHGAAGDDAADVELRAAVELAVAASDPRMARQAEAERALLHALAGRLRAAAGADEVLARSGPGEVLPAAHLARALVAAEQGNTLLASTEHAQARDAAAHLPVPGGRVLELEIELVGGRIVRPGDADGLAARLAALDAATDGWDLPPFMAEQAAALRLRLCSALGDPPHEIADAPDAPAYELAAVLALLAADETAAAQERAARLVADHGLEAATPQGIGALAAEAAARDAEGDAAGAARLAERALDLAEPEGVRLAIADAAPGIEPVLGRLLRFGTTHRSLIGEVLELVRTGSSDAAGAPAAPLREELSGRELAVLRYLPTMLTSQEIAGELFVTLNTVKSHLKSIYRKLDADGRRDAVRRARELGLVAPSGLAGEARVPSRLGA